MGKKSRRHFLKLCAASVPALAFAKDSRAEEGRNSAGTSTSYSPAYRTPGSVEPYIDPLRVPKRMVPEGTVAGRPEYRVRMIEFAQRLHSQLPPTKLWGYEGQYPGLTFEAERNQPIAVWWENHLPAEHLFKIDPHICGATPPAPAVRTVTHLHGSRTPANSDGMPEAWFTPGHSVLYHYPNGQQAATLWYHDHAVGITRLNVYAGLAGFYLLRDEQERGMHLPTGVYEIPLLLQDRTLDEQGQLVYAPTWDDGTKPPSGVWGPGLFGEIPVVNGGLYPYLEVEPCRYRLRLLNGANSRYLRLFFNLASRAIDIPSLVGFHQIGSDGGLLAGPVALKKLVLGPAERADLIVDFSGLEGKTVTLSNDAATPYPGWDVIVSPHYAPLNEWMQFRVTRPLSRKGQSFRMPLPIALPRLEQASSVTTRDFILSERMDSQGHSLGMRINGRGYDDPVTEFVKLDSIEKWRFINTTDDAHAMHLHLVQYQILERQGFNAATLAHGKVELLGSPRAPHANEAGWKDTAVVDPGEVLTILVPFKGYTGRYGFHCHMLEHEDNDMMRPYEVVAAPSASPQRDDGL